MTVNDWLTSIGSEIQQVVSDDSVFTKGVKESVDGLGVSVTLTDQGDYYEAYVVVDPDSKSIEDAKYAVQTVQNVLGSDSSTSVATERNDRWAESHFKVDEEKVEQL